MKISLYTEFHGEILIKDIGKRLRRIVLVEKGIFKILTGYGSTKGTSQSKCAAIKSLTKMKQEGLIKGFIPGELKNILLNDSSLFYQDKLMFSSLIKDDPHYGNERIIFVFV